MARSALLPWLVTGAVALGLGVARASRKTTAQLMKDADALLVAAPTATDGLPYLHAAEVLEERAKTEETNPPTLGPKAALLRAADEAIQRR